MTKDSYKDKSNIRSIKIGQPISTNPDIERFKIPIALNPASASLLSSYEKLRVGVLEIGNTVRSYVENKKITISPQTAATLSSVYDPSSPEIETLKQNESILQNHNSLALAVVGQQDYIVESFGSQNFVNAASATLSHATSLTESVIVINDLNASLLNRELGHLNSNLIHPEINKPNVVDPGYTIGISTAGESIGRYTDRHQNNLGVFNNLYDTSFASSRLTSELINMSSVQSVQYVSNTIIDSAALTTLGSSIYQDYTIAPMVDRSSYLFSAPTIEPYSNIRANSVILGASDSILDENSIEGTESILKSLGDELEDRLNRVDPKIAAIYIEAIAAINSGHQGWIRHAGVSYRELFIQLLNYLAPDDQLNSYYENAEDHKENGKFKRVAQLEYIFRDVAIGSYTQMAKKDIDLAQATFFPSNKVVHSLESPLTGKQMRVLSRRIQGSVSVVLEAAGH